MLRAVIAEELGPLENYRIVPHNPGPPGATQVRVAMRAAGVSFVDVLTARGGYQVKPPLPFIPGSEGAGIIQAVGDDVSPARIGERVQVSNWGGIYADVVNLPAASARPIPDSVTFETAAVFSVSYATAWHALVQRGSLVAGESLLVLGAGGATGCAAIDIGKYLGARVIASASTPEKRALAIAMGADTTVDSTSPSWRDDVKIANGGKPVNVVFDPVSGNATEPAFRTLAWKGRHLVIGFAGGPIAKLPANLALIKGAALIGVDIRQFGIFEPALAATNMAQVLGLLASGVFKPAIAASFPLTHFAHAMSAAALGQSAGRIVITMP